LALTIMLLRREQRPIDTGTVVLWAAIYALALPIWTQLLLVAAIIMAALATQAVFSVNEKREILDRLIRTRRRKPRNDKTLSH
jgi:heme exporter protein D